MFVSTHEMQIRLVASVRPSLRLSVHQEAFKMVVSTDCAIAVDHAFNWCESRVFQNSDFGSNSTVPLIFGAPI